MDSLHFLLIIPDWRENCKRNPSARAKLTKAYKNALNLLSLEKAKEILEKLQDNQAEWVSLKECEIFTYGFRLGARIMLEVVDDSDKLSEVKGPL